MEGIDASFSRTEGWLVSADRHLPVPIYLPTPHEVVSRMLVESKLMAGQKLVDLGLVTVELSWQPRSNLEPGIEPDTIIEEQSGDTRERHSIYIYKLPLKKLSDDVSKNWQWKQPQLNFISPLSQSLSLNKKLEC